MEQDETTRRAKILELVAEYVKSKPDEKFIPGETWVRYAGRVFDTNEYINLIDAALDGWITAGRYSEEFEFSFAKYLGVYSSLIVNSGSSANLVEIAELSFTGMPTTDRTR